MFKGLKMIFFYALLSFAVSPGFAQQVDLRFQRYTMENGLPHNFVDCLLQDSKGFMWFGTSGGLCRFDGYGFQVYHKNDKGPAIADDIIMALLEDQTGNILIGTNRGLTTYRYHPDDFCTYNQSAQLSDTLVAGRITAMSKGADQTVWLGTAYGLVNISTTKEAQININKKHLWGTAANQIAATQITHILLDSHNDLWVSTDNGLYVLLNGATQFKVMRYNRSDPGSLSYNAVNCVYEDSANIYWIGTVYGLTRYNRQANTSRWFFYNDAVSYTLPHSNIQAIISDPAGTVLFGSHGGLSELEDLQLEHFKNHVEDPYSGYSLSSNFINCMLKDRDGNIWIGTERGGINRYNASQKPLENFENRLGQVQSLSNNVINAIAEDEQYIWMGTSGGGLNAYHKEDHTFKCFKYDGKEAVPFSDYICELYLDKDQTLWVGSWGGGLYRQNNKDKGSRKFKGYMPGNGGIKGTFISAIRADSKGNLWIGTREGLSVYNKSLDKFDTLISKQLHIEKIGCLLIDGKDHVWVGTQLDGLYKISDYQFGQGYKLKNFRYQKENPQSLSDNFVSSLCLDDANNLWMGTYGGGLNTLVAEDPGGVFDSYTSANGLPNNSIYALTKDHNGNLWITTTMGLAKMDLRSKTISNYYTSDGLQNNEYFWNAAYCNSHGKLYFGGMHGLNCFYPEQLAYKAGKASKVIITNIKIYNKPIRPGALLDGAVVTRKAISLTDSLSLSYKQKEISFEFSALSYNKPNAIQYAYSLTGFEDKWNETSASRRYANYTNLKPGKYTFQVKMKNPLGQWEAPTAINLKVMPPFWDTWWFKLLALLAVVASIIFYNRYRLYALEQQKERLEAKVKRRTSEIEKQRDELYELNKKVAEVNESKLQFFTNVSHDFRTPLTLIISPIQRLRDLSTDKLEALGLLQQIERNANRLLALMNQLMDFRKLEKGQMKLQVSWVDINRYLADIVDAFQPLAQIKSINLSLTTRKLPREGGWFDFHKIENVLYNLLSNALNHTDEGGIVEVLAFKEELLSANMVLIVKDTGSGMDPNELSLIFNRYYQVENNQLGMGTGIGLALCKELIECHKGEISVESALGQGSTFRLEIPILKSLFDAAELSGVEYQAPSFNKQIAQLSSDLLTQRQSTQEKTAAQPTQDRPVVLLVEDNHELREYIANRLAQTYHVLEAANGKQGYERALEHNPHVIVSDIMMPEVNGLELCEMVKNNLLISHIPIVLLTAKGNVEDEIEGLVFGADSYISKPFNFDLLEANIKNLIDNRAKLFKVFQYQHKLDVKVLATTVTDQKFLDSVIKVIEDNLGNPELNVPFLANKVLISRGHLYRKLQALSNLSPTDFIHNIRMKKAAELLCDLNANVSEVAYAVGFSDPKYFSKVFKKQYNKPPSEYQKDLLNGLDEEPVAETAPE